MDFEKMTIGPFRLFDMVSYDGVTNKGETVSRTGKLIAFSPSGKCWVQRLEQKGKKLEKVVDCVWWSELGIAGEPRP